MSRPTGDTLNFCVGGAEKVRIDSSGRLLVGNTGSLGNACNIFMYASPTKTSIETQNTTTGATNYAATWRSNGGTEIGFINVSNTGTTYDTASDYRLKENQVAISDGITRLKTLKPYRFNFKVEPSKTVDGFFAHEVTPAVPEAITGEKDGTEMQGIDQSKLVPLLTAALQEAITKIETLETKVAALESS
jgi:hypothetical protein